MRRGTAVVWLMALLVCGCASSPPASETGRGVVLHTLRPGENLYRLSLHYGVSVDAIRRANRIGDVTNLQVGRQLRIPGTRRSPPERPLVSAVSYSASPSARGGWRTRAEREANLRFRWPVRGRVSSSFGRRRGRPHEGVDIAARTGTPIHAAEAGRVIHSGRGLGAYGIVVIIKHAGRYSTVYAHNKRNRVRVGDFVERGEHIADVGATGNASGPHLHFEVRHDRRPLNPALFLP